MAKIPPALRREWNEKLKTSGFVDIEDDKGRLKAHNTRTAIWASKEATEEFYSLLDGYMLANAELTRLERRILELYSHGIHFNDIAFDVYRSLAYVKNVVYKHRDRVLGKK